MTSGNANKTGAIRCDEHLDQSQHHNDSIQPALDPFGVGELGFPLSRIFDADPRGRNAGWTAYLYYGEDQATARDARRFGGRGARSDLFSGNVQYKWNQWVTFGYEQGYYRTRADNRIGVLPLFRGIPSYTTHNIRSEFAAIFTLWLIMLRFFCPKDPLRAICVFLPRSE